MGEPIESVAKLQAEAFPPPFSPDLHWKEEHLREHVRKFPEGQFVAVTSHGKVIGSCSSCRIEDTRWNAHGSWFTTVGGPLLEHHDPKGMTLYGLDIAVDPAFRRMGVGRSLYLARYDLVLKLGLARYGTACRIPGFRSSGFADVETYVAAVLQNKLFDRTLSPLLRYELKYLEVIRDYMEDYESDHCAVLLEWTP